MTPFHFNQTLNYWKKNPQVSDYHRLLQPINYLFQ